MFSAPAKPKTTIFTVFFASGSKNHGICNVFWPGPSKNTGIYVVFSMLQERFFSCQKQKNTVNYSIFALGKEQKNGKKSPRSAQNGPPKRILKF